MKKWLCKLFGHKWSDWAIAEASLMNEKWCWSIKHCQRCKTEAHKRW